MFAIKKILSKLTPAQLIVGYYVLAVSISTVLLSLPVALKPGVEFGFMDALFTAVSAVSVTGLTVEDFRSYRRPTHDLAKRGIF